MTRDMRFDGRWRLNRAGVVNVWHYYDTEFEIEGGRLILRGANGSGKSRALELLLPYLLDADRRRMDATGSNKVSLDELMRTGARDQTNRTGYLWLELARPDEYITVGAHVRYSASAHRSEVHFFTTPLRVGHGLQLIEPNRTPLSRDALSDLVGPHNVNDAEGHREAVRTKVFGLRGESGRDRYSGLIQLLHTLRSPDVGNRIDEGRLPQILADALPPLSEQTLQAAGEKLDSLTETRLAQERLADTLDHVRAFHKAYQSYAATVLTDTANAGVEAADAVIDADGRAEALQAELDGCTGKRRKAEAEQKALTDESNELAAAIGALKQHHLFKQADDLKQRDQAVAGLESAANSALANARATRDAETKAAERLRGRLEDLRRAARTAGMTLTMATEALALADIDGAGLPAGIHYSDSAVSAQTSTVMDTLDGKPIIIERPAVGPVAVYPPDLEPIQLAAQRCVEASDRRGLQAQRREQEARRLDDALADVHAQEAAAETSAAHAQSDHDRAQKSASRRDDIAIALNERWRHWISSDATAELLPDIEWGHRPPIAALLHDIEALAREDATTADLLDSLDRLPDLVAQTYREAHAVQIAELDRLQATDDEERARLLAERNELEEERDPAPPVAPWHSAHGGIPLWRIIDFRPEVTPTDRAGIEAALLASGLLTATVRSDGVLEAEDGEVLFRGGQTRVARALTAAIAPDPAAAMPATVIDSLVGSIGLGDPDAPTSIYVDGRWRNGALSGRHTQDAAHHIGAAARAAARQARLTGIAIRLSELGERTRERSAHRDALIDAGRRLTTHVSNAPTSAELVAARAAARADADRAAESAALAHQAEQDANHARTAWRTEFDQHQTVCEGLKLPVAADQLRGLASACGSATEACRKLFDGCSNMIVAADNADVAAADLTEHVARREIAEETAESERSAWHAAAAELAAQHAILDVPVGELTAELERSESAWRETEADLKAIGTSIDKLRDQISAVGNKHAGAQQKAADLHETMIEGAARFNAHVKLPGLADAVSATPFEVISDVHDAQRVRAAATMALGVVGSRKAFTPTQLQHALARFQADTSGQLDVSTLVEHGVNLIHIEGAQDRHHLAAVLDFLERRVAEGKQALSTREREVFTEFVLHGVADELRRRISQARNLVAAMNNSLASVQTSHGIGVRVAWHLDRDEPDLSRILHLVSVADAVRSGDDNDELITLLRRRVEAFQDADPSAGYSAHLADALDYRRWHNVEVNIVGPEPGQQRRISRRAKISQGETRFVSYVTLFAAADGYLSSLPEPETALRLVLLDDAFAKIDEPTIGELMGLLVRFDIDFVMTGHALWGTVPQVPKLDIYEIRRIGGSAAIATRIHWDGKHRHVYAVVPT